MRLFIGLAMLVSVLVLVTACWPFNTAPIASFTASALSGTAPLTVNFSAILSNDPDGIITTYEWDFGDGTSGTGESASHTYTASGTFTIVLRVTDDDGAQDTAQKTITVLPGGGNGGGGTGPTASFTATPLTGASPLTVTFNASASSYAGHAITYYSWDFGDGVTGTGMTTSHTYSPSVTTTYHVVLRIIASDNTEGTASKDITVTVSTPTPPSDAPTASFTVTPDSEQIGPYEFTFDPSASSAVSGHSLTTYVWNFGDQSSQTNTTDATVTHSFYTSQASQSFTVTLTVIDDAGKTDSYSRTVKVKNLQPVAGFEMSKDSGANWGVEDIEITGAQTASQTIWFRSVAPTGDLWDQDRGTVDTDLPNDSTSVKPGNFETTPYTSGDKNLSYDQEGNGSNNGSSWGIVSYVWDFGDGTTETKNADADGSCTAFDHDYQLGADENQKTFTVELEVIDNQGARNTLTRTITLYK
jgi:PKD repeat protein